MEVLPNMRFGKLKTKWSWNNRSYEKVWKCCCDCGGYCYAKEEALVDGIATQCGKCGKNKYIAHKPRNRKESLDAKLLLLLRQSDEFSGVKEEDLKRLLIQLKCQSGASKG